MATDASATIRTSKTGAHVMTGIEVKVTLGIGDGGEVDHVDEVAAEGMTETAIASADPWTLAGTEEDGARSNGRTAGTYAEWFKRVFSFNLTSVIICNRFGALYGYCYDSRPFAILSSSDSILC